MAELLINNIDASTMGIRMGNGFIGALETPADQRDYITNTVRTENGDRIVGVRPKKASRSVTLEFQIVGSRHETGKTMHQSYEDRFDAFCALLDNGFMTISVPGSRKDVYRLYSARKSSPYAKGKTNYGEVGKLSVKFLEPDPTNRGAFSEEDTAKLSLPEIENVV
jgi:hypothetical protein